MNGAGGDKANKKEAKSKTEKTVVGQFPVSAFIGH
jgi:hypothetical protein